MIDRYAGTGTLAWLRRLGVVEQCGDTHCSQKAIWQAAQQERWLSTSYMTLAMMGIPNHVLAACLFLPFVLEKPVSGQM